MKGTSGGGRSRPSTPGATPSRRSSFRVSSDQPQHQCTGSLCRLVFNEIDDISTNANPIPIPNCNASPFRMFNSTFCGSPQRPSSLPQKSAGGTVCTDRVLNRYTTPQRTNDASAAIAKIRADLVRRTQGDAADNGHPFAVQKQSQRRFSSPAAIYSSRETSCASSSPSFSSSLSSSCMPLTFAYGNSGRNSAASALRNSVLQSARKVSVQNKFASGLDYSSRYPQNDFTNTCVHDYPSNTDASPSSSDDLLNSRLHRMTLRSDTRAAKKAGAAHQDNHDYESGDFHDSTISYGDFDIRDESAKMLAMIPPKGLSCLVGLYNEGNTCYLNSCIQCLVHTMPLAASILNGNATLSSNPAGTVLAGSKSFQRRSFSMECGSELAPRRLSEANLITREFRDLLTRMWSSLCPPYSVASASAFLRSLQSWDSQFAGYHQQDAQEAMRSILDGLHESLNRVKSRHYTDIYREYESRPEDELAGITWNYHKSLNDSIIQDIFCGQLQSSIECSVCKKKSHCFDPFLDLSLPLPDQQSGASSLLGSRMGSKWGVSISDCLSLFVAPEALSGHDRYKCSTCKVPQLSTKKLSIYRAPPILVLHLKRFHGSGSFSFRKNDTPVSYPLEGLDLTDYLARATPRRQYYPHGARYDLYAVCNHSGSLGYGHYTAQCKDADGLWYSFNDSSVSTLSEPSIVSSSAYILFYQLRCA
ncbi:hypothetical protein KP509_30G021800 [Ceratopteris richardii]|uniref:Ubiquitin carboxyl-terminal hydrolase n=1 Tax=Ceratopteris richardii TaxID=49495 RepID=A0A8T2R2B1_CERRI|nr:hypothetical protein KP509_30G021800 [Ceratopteris richardii]